jgi:hypothetical protein
MVKPKDARDAAEREALFEHMVCTFVDNVSEKRLKKWDLRNIHEGG